MRVNKTIKSPTMVSLNISGDATELEPIKKHVLSHFTRQVKVPGFRAGKAPLHLVEKNVNQQALLDEFMEHAINELYQRAVRQENLRPVAQPKVELKKFVPYTLIEFDVEVETLGEIKLADYKKIKVPKPEIKVLAKDVTEVIDSLKQRLSERKPVERAAKNGNEVLIDFVGHDKDGKPISGGEGKDYPLQLGSGTFIPGFEEHVVGMKTGDEKEFTIPFPADYTVKTLQGKKVTFKVTIKTVNEMDEPKVDDEFAAKVGPFKSVEELKKDIKKQLQAEREQQAKTDYENALIKAIADKSEAQIPESLVDTEVLRMEESEKRNLVYRGQTWQEHLKEEGLTEEQHRERQKPDAAEKLKASLVLTEIADREKIDVTPEELQIRIQILKGQYQDPAMQAELDKPENQQDIAARILTEKTVSKLVDYASK